MPSASRNDMGGGQHMAGRDEEAGAERRAVGTEAQHHADRTHRRAGGAGFADAVIRRPWRAAAAEQQQEKMRRSAQIRPAKCRKCLGMLWRGLGSLGAVSPP